MIRRFQEMLNDEVVDYKLANKQNYFLVFGVGKDTGGN